MSLRYERPLDRWLNQCLIRPRFWIGLIVFALFMGLVVRLMPKLPHRPTAITVSPTEPR